MGIRFFVLTLLLVIAVPARATDDEAFLLAVHQSLLQELFHQPISQSQSIREYVQGTLMQGTALTSGTVTAAPFFSTDGIGLTLNIQSTTNAFTLNTNVPRPDVQVQFNWTINTSAYTQKNILLRETGFALYPAQSSAQSAITVHGLQTSASGLFWRLKNRVAERRAWETLDATRAQNEYQAATKIAGELNRLVDQRAWDQLLPYHYKYLEYVYHPLITNRLLGGRLLMGSNQSWMAALGRQGDATGQLDVSRIAGLDESVAAKAPVVMRVSAALAERLARMRLGGATFTDVEIAEALGRQPEAPATIPGVLGNPEEEVEIVFDEKQPLSVRFENDRIYFTLRAHELTTLGTKLQEVAFTREVAIESEGGRIRLRNVGNELPKHYDGSPILQPLAKYIGARLLATMPVEPVVLSDKKFFSAKPVGVRMLTARDGKITVGLAPIR